MEEFRRISKEKAKNIALRCKSVCMHLYATNVVPFFQKAVNNKRKIGVAVVAILIVSAVGASALYALNWWKYKDESPTFTSIRKSELAGTSEVGSKFVMEDLEITLQSVSEGTYRPLELDDQGNRVTRSYLAAKIMIFNTGYTEKDFLAFGLEDGKGGQSERDKDVEFYVNELKDFGPAREIYPRTIREGYLNFEAPDADAKSLTLTVLNETTNKKVVFNINR